MSTNARAAACIDVLIAIPSEYRSGHRLAGTRLDSSIRPKLAPGCSGGPRSVSGSCKAGRRTDGVMGLGQGRQVFKRHGFRRSRPRLDDWTRRFWSSRFEKLLDKCTAQTTAVVYHLYLSFQAWKARSCIYWRAAQLRNILMSIVTKSFSVLCPRDPARIDARNGLVPACGPNAWVPSIAGPRVPPRPSPLKFFALGAKEI
jgi:hypothetical protein